MLYRDFQGEALSRLGFGTMRLPLLPGTRDIDEAATEAMIAYALEHGVNYFDTAYPYHGGKSETVVGRILRQYPRERYKLATKYPGHQIAETYDPADIFEKQLKKCQVEYFDFYLLHNVCENSMGVYTDPQWGILDYFKEQKRLGRIRHLGFSSHGQPENLRAFLDYAGDAMEFCQIQMNYLDWSMQEARKKYALLGERGIPVWVMEPVRGGKLASLPVSAQKTLRALRPEATDASWCFRFLQGLDGVTVTLSGMSSMAQMQENIALYEAEQPLSERERAALFAIAEKLRNTVPCTGCRYCCAGCPAGLDIPGLLALYNDVRFADTAFTVGMYLDSLPPEKLPSACLNCGACKASCPQKIDIPAALREFTAKIPDLPNWAKVCAERAAAARK